jgi:hypothetical protein
MQNLINVKSKKNTPLDKIVTKGQYNNVTSSSQITNFSVNLELRPEPLNEDAFIRRFINCRRVIVELQYDLKFRFDPIFTNAVGRPCLTFTGKHELNELQLLYTEGRNYILSETLKIYGQSDTGDKIELHVLPGESIEFDFSFYSKIIKLFNKPLCVRS